MYAKIQISGDILVKTGMHIGGSGAFDQKSVDAFTLINSTSRR